VLNDTAMKHLPFGRGKNSIGIVGYFGSAYGLQNLSTHMLQFFQNDLYDNLSSPICATLNDNMDQNCYDLSLMRS
jgi:hypothetical protein